jgi:hypothetical protein
MSQHAVFADIFPNSAVGIFSPKTERIKTKGLISWLPTHSK